MKPFFRAVFVALSFHALLLMALAHFGAARPDGAVARPSDEPVVEVSLLDSVAAGRGGVREGVRGAETAASRSTASFVVVPARRGVDPMSLETLPNTAQDSTDVERGPHTDGPPKHPGRGHRHLSLAQLGVGQWGAVAVPGVTPKPRGPVRNSVAPTLEQSLREGIAVRERKLGLGAGGPVLSALVSATQRASTPDNASARFSAILDQRGRLVTLTVIEASTDLRRWRVVADQVSVQLKRRSMRVPAGAAGVRLTFRVESRRALPSGADPGLEVNIAGQRIERGAGKRSARIDILKPELSLSTLKVPNGRPGELTEVPTIKLGLGVFGLAADPADLDAPARRVVHARVEREELL